MRKFSIIAQQKEKFSCHHASPALSLIKRRKEFFFIQVNTIKNHKILLRGIYFMLRHARARLFDKLLFYCTRKGKFFLARSIFVRISFFKFELEKFFASILNFSKTIKITLKIAQQINKKHKKFIFTPIC